MKLACFVTDGSIIDMYTKKYMTHSWQFVTGCQYKEDPLNIYVIDAYVDLHIFKNDSTLL